MKKSLFTLIAMMLVLPFLTPSVNALEIIGEMDTTEMPTTYEVTKYYKILTPLISEGQSMAVEMEEESFLNEVDSIKNGVTPRKSMTFEGAYESLTISYTLVNGTTNTYDVYTEVYWYVIPSHRDYDYMVVSYPGNGTSATNFYQTQQHTYNALTHSKDTYSSTSQDYLSYMGIPKYQSPASTNTGTSSALGALFDLYTGSLDALRTIFSTRITGLDITKKFCVTHKHKSSSSSSYLLGNTGVYIDDNLNGFSHNITLGIRSQSYNNYEHLFTNAVSCFNFNSTQ